MFLSNTNCEMLLCFIHDNYKTIADHQHKLLHACFVRIFVVHYV